MSIRIVSAIVIALASSSIAFAQTPPECAAAGDVKFVCGQQGPEDLVVVPGERWVVASRYGGTGGLSLIRASDRVSLVADPAAGAKEVLDRKTYATCPGPPDAAAKAKFTTHGLYLQPGRNSVHRLFVVVHGSRESVEVFELDTRPETPVLTWIGCAIAPDPIGLNSVRALPDGGFIATNFLARDITPEARQKMLAGEKNGELWEWHTASGWRKVPGSEAAGANGIEISDDGKSLYVAAWGTQSFLRLSLGQTPPKRDEISLGFRVDNVRWARDGSLIAAGQSVAPAPLTSNVVKIDPRTLAVREIIRHPQSDAFGAGTVAVEVGKEIWVGSFRGDRIAVFPAR